MTPPRSEWTEYFAECDAAAERADRRATNLAQFGAVLAVLAMLSGVAFVAGLLAQKAESQRRDFIQVALPIAIGTAITFLVMSAVLFGMSSLVELAGRRMVLQMRAERLAMKRSADGAGVTAGPFSAPPPIAG